jgi:hypothetical protein
MAQFVSETKIAADQARDQHAFESPKAGTLLPAASPVDGNVAIDLQATRHLPTDDVGCYPHRFMLHDDGSALEELGLHVAAELCAFSGRRPLLAAHLHDP